MPDVLEVLHELVDAVASLKGISGNKQAELHERLDQQSAAPDVAPAPKVAAPPAKSDGAS